MKGFSFQNFEDEIEGFFKCMAFHSTISKTKMAFKMWFLLIPSINIQCQMLLGSGNMSRREINRWTPELWCLNSSINLKKSKGQFRFTKNIGFIGEKRHNHRMRWFIAINGQDCTSFDESTWLSCERPIGDGASIVSYVACFEEARRFDRPLDLHQTVLINQWFIERFESQLL